MFSKRFLFSIFLISISFKSIKCDKICESLIPDAITSLQNGSIIVFQKDEVWMFDNEANELSGPCPISDVFKDMSGPVNAAVTFKNHETITEFNGTSLYFAGGNFYTFKNMRPYQVEWGALTYLPVKGKQTQIGASAEANDLMTGTITAAYFDPNDFRVKLIFNDKTVLGFNFEFVTDLPLVSTLDEEFGKYGIEELPETISAALTVTQNKKSKVFLFDGPEYCEIQIDATIKKQKCDLKPNSEFFDCKNLKPIKNICETQGFNGMTSEDNPKPIQTQPVEEKGTAQPQVKQPIKVRDSAAKTSRPYTEPSRESFPDKNGCNLLFRQSICSQLILFLIIHYLFK